MIKLGLIGYPLAHSLSPVMHKAALQATGIKGEYVLLGTPPEKLNTMINFIKKSDFKGLNVTIPYKVLIMKYLDGVDKLALKVGAVNTIVIEDNGRWIGHNTDVFGFMYSIPSDFRNNLAGKKALVIGSGGASRAVVAGLGELNVREIEITTLESEIENAREIEKILNQNYTRINTKCSVLKDNIDLSDAAIVVNATPVGMEGKFEGHSPLNERSINSLDKQSFIFDLVYKPRNTKLIKIAHFKGLTTIGGLDMLVLQGARAFHLWTHVNPPTDIMHSSICNL